MAQGKTAARSDGPLRAPDKPYGSSNTPRYDVALCASLAFYEHAYAVQDALEAAGLTVAMPESMLEMKESGVYDMSARKQLRTPADFMRKGGYIRCHLDKIAASTAVLVLNDTKGRQLNYIGPNVLIEMSLAFYQKKPIFILNEVPADSPFLDEIKGMGVISLHSELDALVARFKR